jgi:hypothetical protein
MDNGVTWNVLHEVRMDKALGQPTENPGNFVRKFARHDTIEVMRGISRTDRIPTRMEITDFDCVEIA